jgi:RNA polymerase sigma-70 factor (ECF subfamily)
VSDGPDHVTALLALYDDAVPQVFGYLRSRSRDRDLAHDLTADTFLAAVGQARRGAVDQVSVPWLIGIARHKLLDHWRRAARTPERRELDDAAICDDPWDVVIDRQRVGAVLDQLGPHHRAALTLRYLDGLPVPQVAQLLDRTVHATEALLVRARAAFRLAYEGTDR